MLHAPYANGEYFFKILPDEKKAVEIKQGSDGTVGTANTSDDGSYTESLWLRK